MRVQKSWQQRSRQVFVTAACARLDNSVSKYSDRESGDCQCGHRNQRRSCAVYLTAAFASAVSVTAAFVTASFGMPVTAASASSVIVAVAFVCNVRNSSVCEERVTAACKYSDRGCCVWEFGDRVSAFVLQCA